MKKIVLTGGGTAGHVYPALALLPYLSDYEIHFIGSNGIEKEILKDYKNIKFYEIPAVKLVRSLTLKNFLIPFKLISSIKKAKRILREIDPDIIFSKGGFVSVPVVYAGKRLKIKVISHESDLSMGLANKINLKFCDVMCTAFKETSSVSKKCVYTGQPLRKEILQKGNPLFKEKFPTKKPVLLVIGGSLGANFLNEIVINNLFALTKKFNIIHITGKNFGKKINDKSYLSMPFSQNIQDVYASCDIALSRAGSGAINELLASSIPSLLIPLSKKCSRGDQIENAVLFEKKGLARVLMEEDANKESLINALEKLLKDSGKIKDNMKKSGENNACEKIVGIINKLIKTKK